MEFLGDELLPQDPQPIQDPKPSLDQRLDSILERRRREADALATERFGLATKTNPDLRAEAQRVGSTLGLDPALAERNIDVARAIAAKRDYESRQLEQTSPGLAAMFRNLEFARIAHDDLNSLTLGERVVQQWNVGQLTVDRGRLYEQMKWRRLEPVERRRLTEIDQWLQTTHNARDPISGAATYLGQWSKTLPNVLASGLAVGATFATGAAVAGQMGPQVALPEEIATVPIAFLTGFKIGGGASMLTQAYEMEAGNAYGDMLARGFDPKTSAYVSSGVGLVNMGLEAVGGLLAAKAAGLGGSIRRSLLNEVRDEAAAAMSRPTTAQAALRFAKGYASGVSGEVATEVTQEIANIIGEELARGGHESQFATPEGRRAIVERLGAVAGQTALGMSLLGLPGPARVYLQDSQRVARAERSQKLIQDLAQASKDIKVRERNPWAYEAFLVHAGKGGAETIYVDAQQFWEVLRQNEIDEGDLEKTMPDVAAMLRKAEQNADLQMDVLIPTAKFGAHLAGTPLGDALLPHMRLDADAMSMAEAQEWVARQQSMAEEASSLLPEQMEARQAFDESAAKVEEALYQQIRATKRLPNAKQERAAAQFYRDMVVTQAVPRGLTPEQFYERYPVRVVRGDGQQSAASLRQNEDAGNLTVVHNLTADKLEHADRMGGLAVPSLAITKKDSPLRGFGDITLVGTRRLADPKQGARVFGADVYSPRYPSVGYKLDDKALRGLNEELAPYRKGRLLYGGEIADLGDLTQTDAFKDYVAATLGENASWSDTKRAAQDMLRRVGATERIFRGFTDSGNRKYIAHTLDNVVRILKKDLRAGEGFNYGVGSLRARFTPQFRSIKAIKAAEDKLVTKEQFDAIKKEIDEEFLAVAAAFGDIRLDTAIAILEEAPTKGLEASAKDFDIELSDDAKKKAVQFLEKLRHLPTAYFEAKHLRAVQLEEFAGALVPKGTRPEVLDRLRAAGLDVAEYDGEQSYAGAFTSLTAAMNARRGDVLFQEGELQSGAKGGFIPETLTVLLNEKADISTFLHESAHAFLTIYGDMAAQGDAQATADLTTLLDWFGVKDVATWNAMTLEQQRKHHEKFAYSFEGYLFDGVAPNEEMRGLFDRFKVWLRAIYKTIRDNIGAAYRKEFGEDLPILTGEVRQVMDRMLASEQTIAEAEAVRSMVPMFQTQEQYLAKGGTPDGYAAYQQMAQEAREAGVAELERRSLRAMEWLSGARGRLLKAAQAQHNAIRKRVRAEVVAEVKQNPRDQARRWLLRGELVQEDGNIGKEPKGTPHTMDRAAVEALVPGADLSKIDKMLSVGGLNPDQVAEALNTSLGSDFTSGEGLVRAMLEMRPFEEVVDARTDERMHAEHSDLADPAEVEAAVERALHNDARARFDAAGLRHLQGATQPVRVMLAAAKEAARQAISGMPLRDVSAKKFAQAEARAARKAMDAMKKGDSAEAAEWQQKRLLQHALSTVAGEVQQDVAKELRNIARFRKPDAKLAKSRNIDLVNAARWILSRYNLGTPNQAASATKALQAVAAYDANMGAQLAPLIADAEQNGRDYRDLSVDQFRDLMGKVDGLWNDSRRDQQIRLDGKLVEKAEARERIGEQLAKAAAKGRKPVSGLLRGIGGITASLRHVESWALEMDGGQPGPVHDLLFRMLRDRYDDYLLQRKEMAEALQDRSKELPNLYGRKYEARYLKDKNGVPHVWKDRAQVIGWVLHLGNLENARKDAVGRGWVVKAKDGTADLSPVFRELQRLIDEGHVTKADMQFVQGSVWDTYEHTLKPKAQAAHKDVYGYYFTEVDGSPLELRFPDGSTEKFRGGYAPAKPDPDLEEARPGQVSADGITESGAEFADRHPSAPKGFTITRTGVDRALMHDLRMVPQSFAEELQFIHMQRAGKDLAALLNDKDIAAAIRAVDPDAIEAMFRPWLSDTMRDRLMAPGGNKVVNRALVALRRNVGMAHMFGNVANAFQQVTGLATAATYVPMKHLRAGARSMTQAGQIDRMKAASKFMRLRIDKRLGQITDDIDGALKTTWTGKAAGWTRRNAYFLQRWFQMPVDLITWFGAHDQAMAQGKTDAQAVAWADAAVRRSQGSGVAPDISRFERSSAPIRLLTQFGGFWLAQFNTLAQRHGAERATAAANVILFAGVTAGAISQALKGGWDDDDEDGQLWDDVLSWTFGETVRTGASLLPVIGPAAYVWTTGDRGGRASPMAVVSTMDQAARGFGTFAAMFDPERDVKGADIKATGLLLATFSAFPWFSALARPASYATDVQRGNVVPSGPGDAARGLLTGSVAPGTRQ